MDKLKEKERGKLLLALVCNNENYNMNKYINKNLM